MKSLKSFVLAACAVLVGVAYALPSSQAFAQSAALSITPKKNYVIEPGKSVSDKLVIRNLDTVHPLDVTLRVIDFTFMDQTGAPKLFLAQDAAQTTWSLKPFLTLPKTVSVPKGGSKSVDMSISIPANQGAGSYYSAIIYSTGAPDGGNVGLAASGVTLAFVNVPGKVKEDLQLKKLGAYHTAQPGKPADYDTIAFTEPKNIGYTLLNNGNVTEAPVGSITIKDMFGRVTTINNVNPSNALALIGQTRTFSPCIKLSEEKAQSEGSSSAPKCESPGFWPGRYSVSIDLFYGQNGNTTQEVIGNSSFWYIPWWFMIVLAVIIGALAFVIWKVVSIVRGKNRRSKPHRSSRK